MTQIFGSYKKKSYLCSVRMSSEGANICFRSRNSSWTFLTVIRGHSPQGYVLSFSITSLISCLMVSILKTSLKIWNFQNYCLYLHRQYIVEPSKQTAYGNIAKTKKKYVEASAESCSFEIGKISQKNSQE